MTFAGAGAAEVDRSHLAHRGTGPRPDWPDGSRVGFEVAEAYFRPRAERERSGGQLYDRLINGDRGGYLGYATWRKYPKLAHGYSAAHPDGVVSYTAHELRHVCASLLIASGASDMQVAHQTGHSKIETTKNIYGHLFAQDRASILDGMNQAVSRLYVYETPGSGGEESA